MSDDGFWESEEIEENADAIDQIASEIEGDISQETEQDSPTQDSSEDEIIEYFTQEQSEESLDDSELVSNARLRLEQGRLYEMLLNHDLFGNVQADDRAIKNVQKEIRNFIKERLEVLLGLKPDPRLQPILQNQVDFPFTPLEVDLLKKVLAKMSGGATQQEVYQNPVQAPTPVIAPPKQFITPLSGSRPPTVIAPKQSKVKVIQKQKPAPQSVQEPASSLKFKNEKIKKQLEALGENEMPLGKPLHKINKRDLLERNRRITARQAARQAQAVSKLPTPTGDAEQAVMMNHIMTRSANVQAGVSSKTPQLALALTKVLHDKAGSTDEE